MANVALESPPISPAGRSAIRVTSLQFVDSRVTLSVADAPPLSHGDGHRASRSNPGGFFMSAATAA